MSYRSHDYRSRNDSRNESRYDSRNESRYDSRNESRYDSRNDSRYDSRCDRPSRWQSSSSHDRGSSRDPHHSYDPSFSRYHWSKDTHSSDSDRSGRGASRPDKPFTIVKPAEKSFTVVKPEESRDFTIITNEDNDFDRFTDCSRTRPSQCDIYSQLSLKQSNYFIFGSKTSSDIRKMCFLYAVARMIYEGETNEALIPAIAAAEFAVDYLPSNRRLFGTEADDYFVRVMAKAVRDPKFIDMVRINDDLYATLESFGLPRVYPTLKPESLDGKQYMRILQILSTSLVPAHADCDLVIALTAVAPCLVLNSVTQTFLRRLESTVEQELRKRITLNIGSTNVFFEQYLKEASEDEVEEMLVYWRTAIPATAEQLRAQLKRYAGNGLLHIALIGRALAECGDFPWDKTLALYRDDWKALSKVMPLVVDDPYYGYRRDKDEIVNPCHYRNLAWLGRQLCIAKLHDDYPNFNLWVDEPSHAAEIKKLIAAYAADSRRESTAMDVS